MSGIRLGHNCLKLYKNPNNTAFKAALFGFFALETKR
jgi:hypothetical protein